MSCSNCGSSGCGGCHNCSSCGSALCLGNCGCSCSGNSIYVPPVSATCSVRPCSPLESCSSSGISTPDPYYNQTPTCQENNCQQIINYAFSAVLCANYAFTMPGCGLAATVYFSDLKNIIIGAYLWNPTYGYLQVAAFNSQTGQVIVTNPCTDGNAEAGTSIAACTCFVVAPAPASTPGVGACCVAIDFTAPAIGNCLDITVTNVNGIVSGGLIQIGSGVYRVNTIVSSTVINICNDGSGITAGTPVIALDSHGNYQYCISVLGFDPCAASPAADGSILVCHNGDPVILDSPSAASTITVPLCTDATNNIFTATDIQCSNFQNKTATNYSAAVNQTGSLTAVGNQIVGNTATLVITNTSTCRTMSVLLDAIMFVYGHSNVGDTGSGTNNLVGALSLKVDAVPVSGRNGAYNPTYANGSQLLTSFEMHTPYALTIGPGVTKTITVTSTLTKLAGAGTNTHSVTNYTNEVTAVEVAV